MRYDMNMNGYVRKRGEHGTRWDETSKCQTMNKAGKNNLELKEGVIHIGLPCGSLGHTGGSKRITKDRGKTRKYSLWARSPRGMGPLPDEPRDAAVHRACK